MKTVYVDNAATTKVRQEVIDAMNECNEHYGNPSSTHSMGQKIKELIDNARNKIAASIGAKSNEIIFTSGGTEANNLALQGFVNANDNIGSHIITTSIEHASVLNPVRYLRDTGCDVTYLPVDDGGVVDLQRLQMSIRRNTILISIMFANNEIGTIQPIKAIGDISKRYNICFHTDAVQALGHCDIDVDELGIDMMSMSGHKIYGPKGVGALYVKNTVDLAPIIYGGGQEYNLRSGTENVNAIVGFGKAVELLDKTETKHLSTLKNKLIDGVMGKIHDVRLNGSSKNSLCSIVNLGFDGIEVETLLKMLDSKGIYASKCSACLADNFRPSHVLRAIGTPEDFAYGSLRFSFGRYNTESEVDYILDVLPELVEQLRKEAL